MAESKTQGVFTDTVPLSASTLDFHQCCSVLKVIFTVGLQLKAFDNPG